MMVILIISVMILYVNIDGVSERLLVIVFIIE